jgi:hypothetical protein
MSKITLVSFIDNRLKYVQLMATCGSPQGSPKHALLIAECLTGILTAVRNTKQVAAEHAIEIRSLLGYLPPESVEVIMSAISAKVNLASTGSMGTSNADRQSNVHLDVYLKEQSWELFQNLKMDTHTKLLAMASIFIGLGMLKVTEKTYAVGAAIATQTSGYESNQLLDDTRKLKSLLRSIDSSGVQQGPDIYPDSTEVFKANYPEIYKHAYPDHGPCPTKWSAQYRLVVQGLAVCRSSKTGVQDAKKANAEAAALGHGMLGIGVQRRASMESLPGFKWCLPNVNAFAPPQYDALHVAMHQPQQQQQLQLQLQQQVPALTCVPTHQQQLQLTPQKENQLTPDTPTSESPAMLEASDIAPNIFGKWPSLPAPGVAPCNASASAGAVTKLAPSMADITAQIKLRLQAKPAVAAEGGDKDLEPIPPSKKGKRLKAAPSKKAKPSKAAPSKKAKRAKAAPQPKKKAMTRPSVFMKKPAAAWKPADGKPACPELGSVPVLYKQAKIYISETRKSFRVICVATNYATEVSVKWESDKPNARSWAEALKKVDAYRP